MPTCARRPLPSVPAILPAAITANRRAALVSVSGAFLAAALGCGGDGTGPSALPNVAGRYQRNEAIAPVTCTPQTPPAGGTVIFGAFSLSDSVRIQQTGSRLTLTYLGFPGTEPDTGSVDRDGKVTFGFRETFQEEPRAGNRIFFDDLTASQEVRRVDNGARLTGAGGYVNIFHEGSATAPVFATCSRTSTIELTRTGS
jgi:hypothetical protein